MDLHATILGLLSWKPASGYDLKQIITDSEIFYWSGNNNQIYKCLLELQQAGSVTHQVQLQDNLPAKKIYTITEQGLAELRQSLLAAPELPDLRNSFLIQLAWAEILSDDEVLALLTAYEEEVFHRLRLLEYQAEHPVHRPERSPRETYLWRQLDENRVASFHTELDWIRATRLGLLSRDYPDQPEP